MAEHSGKKRKWMIFVVAIVLLAVFWCVTAVVQAKRWKQWVNETCADADRVVLDLNTWPRRSDEANSFPVFPIVTIDDSAKVKELLRLIEFKPRWLPGHCRCFGEMTFLFCQGEKELLALSYHHGQSFRCGHQNSDINIFLTEASRVALSEWLTTTGGGAWANALHERERLLDEWHERCYKEDQAATMPSSNPASQPTTVSVVQ